MEASECLMPATRSCDWEGCDTTYQIPSGSHDALMPFELRLVAGAYWFCKPECLVQFMFNYYPQMPLCSGPKQELEAVPVKFPGSYWPDLGEETLRDAVSHGG